MANPFSHFRSVFHAALGGVHEEDRERIHLPSNPPHAFIAICVSVDDILTFLHWFSHPGNSKDGLNNGLIQQ